MLCHIWVYCKNTRFDWLISGPSNSVLNLQKDVFDRKIKRPNSAETNKMDDQNVYASFSFLNEIFILNETEKLERIYLPTTAVKEDTRENTNMFSLKLLCL